MKLLLKIAYVILLFAGTADLLDFVFEPDKSLLG